MEDKPASTYNHHETRAADIPSTSHSIPAAFFPSLHRHLAGCFNDFPSEEQLAAKEALLRCDEDVSKLTSQICSTQMATIQEIKRILHGGQSRKAPLTPPDGSGAADTVTTLSPLRATRTAPNMEEARQCQPPSSRGAVGRDVLLHEGHNIEADTEATDAISFTQIVSGDGFNKLSSSQQGMPIYVL
jgi:hypothetical protein